MKRNWWIILFAAAALLPAGGARAHGSMLEAADELFWADERILVIAGDDRLCYTVGELTSLGLWKAPQVYAAARPARPQQQNLFELTTAKPFPETDPVSYDLAGLESWSDRNADPEISVPSILSEPAPEPAEITLVPEPNMSSLGLLAAVVVSLGFRGKKARARS